MAKKFYITTACPYVNAAPHAGHALEYVQTDVIARCRRLLGDDTYFLTGSDENSLKNVQAAEKLGISPQKLCDKNSRKFYQFKNILNISFDLFVRTTGERHRKGAQALWRACKKEDIYKKNYKGLYCVGCEVFYNPDELVSGKCPEHLKEPEVVEEENYFFRLSNYQSRLEKLIVSDELRLTPETRKNEVLSFIRRGLEDFSISRSIARAHGWGISVPGDPNQIIYVWFDALSYYLTGLGYKSKNDELFKKYWPADLQVIGKGITRFHAVYWPAMLLSAGLPLPKAEFVHGYLTIEGQKISKSLGNVIDPFDLVKRHGTDPIRYYLLREIPGDGDGDFSETRFRELYNADLANGLGNLLSRVTALAEKYCDGKVPEIDKDPDSHPLRIDKSIYNWGKARQGLDEAMGQYKFNEALASIWRFIGEADKYINDNKPWELAKKDKFEFNWVLYGLLDGLCQIAWQISPFLPETTREIAKRLNIEKLLTTNPQLKDSLVNIKPGTKIETGKPLFPRKIK